MSEQKQVNVNDPAEGQSALNAGLGLLPCPFCGGIAVITHKDSRSRVECLGRFEGCKINMRTHSQPNDELAIAAWNTRA